MFRVNPKMTRYTIVNTVTKLRKLAAKMAKLEEFSFDTETNTLKVLGPNKDFKLVGISISWGSADNYYIPVGHVRVEDMYRQLDLETVVAHLRPVFEREDVRLIGRNLKFDMHVMRRVGIHIKTEDLFDSMIASWLCDENSPNGLKDDSARFLKVDQTHFADVIASVPNEVKKQFGLKANNKATFDLVLIEDGAPYALMDSFYAWELYLGFLDLLVEEKMDKIYYKVYAPFIRVLYDMEEHGICVDTEKLRQMSTDMKQDMGTLEYRMFELAGTKFNPGSTQQLAELLFGHEKEGKKEPSGLLNYSFGFRVFGVTKTGSPSVDADTLWKLSRMDFKVKRKREGVELCKRLSEYKKIAKLSSAFVDGLIEKLYDDDKAHPSFNIIGTDSGRLSCSSPNLQQLPKADDKATYQIRSLFYGDLDKTGKRKKIVALDFSNLEMRVLAHFSEDKNLLEMFARGADTHGSTAVNMFQLDCDPSEVKKKYPHLRQAAKIINFMLMYGGGAPRLYEALREDHDNPIDLGDESYLKTYHAEDGVEVAQIYIDRYFKTYSGVAEFIKDQKRCARRNGYVQTLLRRKRRLPDINGLDYRKVAYCERLSVNSTIQGSAADITMSAQNRIAKDPWFEENGAYMLLQVHDELVFECPEHLVEKCIEKVKWYMEHPFGDKRSLNLPLNADADFGNNYQEAK